MDPSRPRRTLASLLAPGLGSHDGIDEQTDWGPVLAAAADEALLPALRLALDARRLLPSPPAAVRAAAARHLPDGAELPSAVLDDALAANRVRIEDLLDQLHRLLAALEQEDILAVPLKGADAVLVGRYPEPAGRTMTDLDVLVPAEHAERADQVLADLGYERAPAPPASHQLPPRRDPDRAGSVELHVALVGERWSALVDPVAVLRRAQPASDGPGLRLDRTDAALHLVAHAQLHDDADLLWSAPLRALHETALVLAGQEPVDWERVAAAFDRVGRRRALAAHLLLTSRLLGVDPPLPAGAGARTTVAVELALLDRPAARRRAAELRYLPRALDRERMATRYGARSTGEVTLARARHVAGGISRRLRRPLRG